MPNPSPRLPENLSVIVAEALTPFEGALYCHVPADEPVDLAALAHGGDASDRWSRADQPTVYLASDAGVVLAELGRHEHGLDGSSIRRQLLRLDVAGVRLLDVRREDVARGLGIDGVPHAYLDRALARAVGCAMREVEGCQGLMVPSMALLDDPERHCVVLFDDAIEGGFTTCVRACTVRGVVDIRPGAPVQMSPPALLSAAKAGDAAGYRPQR